MKTKTKVGLGLVISILVIVVGIQTHLLVLASEIVVVKADPVCTSLTCEIERRTITKYKDNHDMNMESARLQVLQDLNTEMGVMITDKTLRLNN